MPGPEASDPSALQAVDIRAAIDGVFLLLDIAQSYGNTTARPLEASYSFPLASGAVVLGVSCAFNGNAVQAGVVDAGAAGEAYEAALEDGRIAVMVERLPGGFASVSLGPLAAGAQVQVTLRIGLVLTPDGNGDLRLDLPTVFSRPEGAQRNRVLAAHQRPLARLDVEYPLSLSIDLIGHTAGAMVSSPSHALTLDESGPRRRATLQGAMDRDVVLIFEGADLAPRLTHWADQAVIVAPLRGWRRDTREPVRLHVVVDASGSLAGDAAASLTLFLSTLHGALRGEDDRLTVTRLGRVATPVLAFDGLRADLGDIAPGGAAPIVNLGVNTDVLLISDGNSRVWEAFSRTVTTSGQRMFMLGVGAAPDRYALAEAAAATGGAYLALSPADLVEPVVERLMDDLLAPAVDALDLIWSDLQGGGDGAAIEPDWVLAPSPKVAARGGLVIAGFSRAPVGTGRASLRLGRDVQAQDIAASRREPLPDYARIAAAGRLAVLDEAAASLWARKLGVMTEGMAWLAQGPTAPIAEGAPLVFQVVPQMMMAGQRGLGRLDPLALRARRPSLGPIAAILTAAALVGVLAWALGRASARPPLLAVGLGAVVSAAVLFLTVRRLTKRGGSMKPRLWDRGAQ